VPLFVGGARFPSNTMSPGPMPTSVPSDILIYPAIWPQQTGRKVGGMMCPFPWGELGPYMTLSLGRGLPPHQAAS